MPNRVHPLAGTSQNPQDAPVSIPLDLFQARGPENVQPDVSGEQGRRSRRRKASTSLSIDSEAKPTTFMECCLDLVCSCIIKDEKPSNELNIEAARNTHHLSNFITRVQCFLKPLSMNPSLLYGDQDKKIKEVLGICVQNNPSRCCDRCFQCTDCGVCPHMYTCNCPVFYKYGGSSWCAHIHVMHKLTKRRFKNRTLLYIQTDLRYTLMRHVRAYLLSEDFMIAAEMEGAYCAATHDRYPVAQAQIWNKCSCEKAKSCRTCPGCRCYFVCRCVDFEVDGMTCQHVHSAAMHLDGGTLFYDTHVPKAELSYTLNTSSDKNQQYYVALEHLMSFYIKESYIKKQEGPPPEDLFIARVLDITEEEGLVNVENPDNVSQKSSDLGETYKVEGEDSWWVICRKYGSDDPEVECRVRTGFECKSCAKEQTTDYSRCTRCGICRHSYACDCPLDPNIICRHVHAVHRMLKNPLDTEEESVAYYKVHLPTPAFRNFLPAGYEPKFEPFLGNLLSLVDVDKQNDEMYVSPISTD